MRSVEEVEDEVAAVDVDAVVDVETVETERAKAVEPAEDAAVDVTLSVDEPREALFDARVNSRLELDGSETASSEDATGSKDSKTEFELSSTSPVRPGVSTAEDLLDLDEACVSPTTGTGAPGKEDVSSILPLRRFCSRAWPSSRMRAQSSCDIPAHRPRMTGAGSGSGCPQSPASLPSRQFLPLGNSCRAFQPESGRQLQCRRKCSLHASEID